MGAEEHCVWGGDGESSDLVGRSGLRQKLLELAAVE